MTYTDALHEIIFSGWSEIKVKQYSRYWFAFALRTKGMTYKEIGLQLNVSHERARQLAVLGEKWIDGIFYRVEIEKKICANGFDRDLVKLDECEFTCRTANCFKNAGLKKLPDIQHMTDDDFLALPNFGKKSLVEVREFLKNIDDYENGGKT